VAGAEGLAGPVQRTAPRDLAGSDRLADPVQRTAPRDRADQLAAGAPAGRALPVARTPFILLVLALLGCGLICLLVINTTLATASFRISHLQQGNVTLSQQVQVLEQQVASEQTPARIEQQALRLGMRQQRVLSYVDVRNGRVYTQPATVPGLTFAPPGYTP
jgi:hypothetical protein